MNTAYIITYDLRNPGRNYEELLRRIHSYQTWAMVTESTYVIISFQNPVQIRDYLQASIDWNDKIFVGVLKAPAAWNNLPEEVSQWLRDHLK